MLKITNFGKEDGSLQINMSVEDILHTFVHTPKAHGMIKVILNSFKFILILSHEQVSKIKLLLHTRKSHKLPALIYVEILSSFLNRSMFYLPVDIVTIVANWAKFTNLCMLLHLHTTFYRICLF